MGVYIKQFYPRLWQENGRLILVTYKAVPVKVLLTQINDILNFLYSS